MKFDTVIIGGGLSGLVCGIKLARAHRRVAIISNGQSALHFCAGSFGLLAKVDGKPVDNPVEAMASLPGRHPYRIIGLDRARRYADQAPLFFAEAGLTLKGTSLANHSHITPVGLFKPAWLTMSDFMTFDAPSVMRRCVIVNFKGYLDFYPQYIAAGLATKGLECSIATVEIDALERLRRSSGEMRASSIARLLHGEALEQFAIEINKVAGDADAVFIPAAVGFDSEEHLQRLRRMVAVPLYCIPVTPMSVCGLRAQMLLRRHFCQLGGTYLLGDCAVAATYHPDGSIASLETASLGADHLVADNYVLASGGFFSRGIVAAPHRIFEPLFDLDIDAPADRDLWYSTDFFSAQPYLNFGVSVDDNLHPYRKGQPVANLFAVGAVLGGCDTLAEESGAGVAVLTAMRAADIILKAE